MLKVMKKYTLVSGDVNTTRQFCSDDENTTQQHPSPSFNTPSHPTPPLSLSTMHVSRNDINDDGD
jgi:hypothetical protein